MHDFALLPVLTGALAFFAVSQLWYGAAFGGVWRKAAGFPPEPASAARRFVTAALSFGCQMLIAAVLWHLLVRTNPAPHVVMMMAIGFAVGVMIPAMALVYLAQRKPLSLYLIDGGQFICGMAALGGVFVLWR